MSADKDQTDVDQKTEKKKKNPFDTILDELESYDDGCDPLTLGDSGE